MEEYNTASFPSKKYYDLKLWERKVLVNQDMKQSKATSQSQNVDLLDDEKQKKLEIEK